MMLQYPPALLQSWPHPLCLAGAAVPAI